MQITVFEVFLNHVQNFTPNSPQYHITLNKAVLGCCAIHCITITYHRVILIQSAISQHTKSLHLILPMFMISFVIVF